MGTVAKSAVKKSGKVVILAPTPIEEPDRIELTEIYRAIFVTKLVGLSPLICNAFGPKIREQMEAERGLTKEQKLEKKKAGRPPVVPEERFQNARTLDAQGRDCIQANYVKQAMISALKFEDVGIKDRILRGAVFVQGELLPIHYSSIGKAPEMHTGVVRVGPWNAKDPDLRYRPIYHDWSVDVRIEYEPKLVPAAALMHLLRRAGTSIGLCEWRPQCNGIYGRFDIDLGKK